MSDNERSFKYLESYLKNIHTQLEGKGMKRVMKLIGRKFVNEISLSFENERSPFGTPWAPLAKSTIKRKSKKGKSGKILREDGNLADRWLVEATPDSVTIINNSSNNGFPYGLTHQNGSKKIPARPFLPIDNQDRLEKNFSENILNSISDELDRMFD